MGAIVRGAQDIVPKGGIELRQRESRRCRGCAVAEIPRKRGETLDIIGNTAFVALTHSISMAENCFR